MKKEILKKLKSVMFLFIILLNNIKQKNIFYSTNPHTSLFILSHYNNFIPQSI